MNIALVIQIITAALQLAPLAVNTYTGIKNLLAADPAVPESLRTILLNTVSTNQEVHAQIQEWMLANPQV